jgi:hypothetical protein
MKGANMSDTFFYGFPGKIIITLLLVAILFIALISSCSKTMPSCDYKKTVKAVRAEAMETLLDDISSVASLGGGELSEDEKRMFKASMNVDVGNIKQKSIDENANRYTCAADLTVKSAGGVEIKSITYTSIVHDGEVQISISGLQ